MHYVLVVQDAIVELDSELQSTFVVAVYEVQAAVIQVHGKRADGGSLCLSQDLQVVERDQLVIELARRHS